MDRLAAGTKAKFKQQIVSEYRKKTMSILFSGYRYCIKRYTTPEIQKELAAGSIHAHVVVQQDCVNCHTVLPRDWKRDLCWRCMEIRVSILGDTIRELHKQAEANRATWAICEACPATQKDWDKAVSCKNNSCGNFHQRRVALQLFSKAQQRYQKIEQECKLPILEDPEIDIRLRREQQREEELYSKSQQQQQQQ